LDRVVKKPADFQRFAGRRINVRLRLPENGQRNFHSVLRGFEDGGVVLEDEGGRRRFALDSIEEARLEPEVEI
ncbi:MAG: ribosome maturation factor RimP, partial [Elusimicrobia bacterium]|nr:ribosome maturation factor RimP [Elusimicrobiota bacterium]